jgi:hypothetical protein
MTILGREPAVWVGIIVSCIFAVVGVLSGEGLINDALKGQITDGVNAVAQLLVLLAPVITGIVIRGQVTPNAKPSLPQGTIVEVVTPEGQLNKQTIL